MPQGDFKKIIEKYVEMSISHPFLEGNIFKGIEQSYYYEGYEIKS